jgi:hypothetical protein
VAHLRPAILNSICALVVALSVGSSASSTEQVLGNGWRWSKMEGAEDRWWLREGYAYVETNGGNFRATLVEDGDSAPSFVLAGTYRFGKADSAIPVQSGSIRAKVTTLNSDFGINVPYTGTYRKEHGIAGPPSPVDVPHETIILSNGFEALWLMKLTK